MGKIKSLLIKKIAEKILAEHKEKFTEDFEKNKEIVKSIVAIKSKKLRNILAGYITSLIKKK